MIACAVTVAKYFDTDQFKQNNALKELDWHWRDIRVLAKDMIKYAEINGLFQKEETEFTDI